MKEYVYIQSTMDITVTAGLQNEDVTNPDAHIPDRLKVNPVWPKMRIMIEQGRHIYPKLIAEWDTVKSLVKAGILTIGEDADKPEAESMAAKKDDLKEELRRFEASKKAKDIKLEEAAK